MKRFFSHSFEEILGAIFLAVMVSVAFLNVVTRYVLKYSMAFTEELTLYLFVWVTLLGTSLAFKDGANMSVTIFYNRFGKKWRKALHLIAAACTIIFFAGLAYWGAVEVMEEIEMSVTTEALEFPVWFFTISMPVVAVFTIFRVLARTRKDIKDGDY